jgi:hypothetical protein
MCALAEQTELIDDGPRRALEIIGLWPGWSRAGTGESLAEDAYGSNPSNRALVKL